VAIVLLLTAASTKKIISIIYHVDELPNVDSSGACASVPFNGLLQAPIITASQGYDTGKTK
jgi:hypothetical protein